MRSSVFCGEFQVDARYDFVLAQLAHFGEIELGLGLASAIMDEGEACHHTVIQGQCRANDSLNEVDRSRFSFYISFEPGRQFQLRNPHTNCS
jgi:hypothetical protein